MIKFATMTLPPLILLSACSWVELTETGKKVRVLQAEEVGKCQLMGQTTATVIDKVAGLRRHDEAIREDLLVVARNAAKNLDGDTIVAAGEETDGSQLFKVYRCVPR